MKLAVAGPKTGLIAQRQGHHLIAQMVIEQVGSGGLKRVEGRYDKPHLVQTKCGSQLAGQGYVAHVNGVERTTKDAYLPNRGLHDT